MLHTELHVMFIWLKFSLFSAFSVPWICCCHIGGFCDSAGECCDEEAWQCTGDAVAKV